MVEGSLDDGNFLVRVRAQVMTRDDSTGGWVPMGGGGLSNVSVRKRIISEDEKKPEYVICGKRISDQTIVLSCTIKRDFQYNKVMPTFHHWRTGDKKFGLTFQTAADARAFDKGVRTAVEDLLEGVGCGQRIRGGDDAGDDDVFMALELPIESRSSTGSSSESANGMNTCRPTSATSSIPGDTFSVSSSPYSHPHSNQHQHLQYIHFMKPSRTMPGVSSSGTSGLTSSISVGAGDLQKVQGEDIWVKERTHLKDSNPNDPDKIELSTLGSYSYVQFSKDRAASRAEHEYCYPAIETMKMTKEEYSTGSLKKSVSTVSSEPPLLPSKSSRKESRRQQASPTQLKCRLCLDEYTEDTNHPGSCRFGPDRTLNCIGHVTCYSCAHCMLYHCMSDAEGDFNDHPCTCDASSDDHCRRRWTGLALLSIFVPCLWCYLPLRACHRCGVSCGYCGGKHQPEQQPRERFALTDGTEELMRNMKTYMVPSNGISKCEPPPDGTSRCYLLVVHAADGTFECEPPSGHAARWDIQVRATVMTRRRLDIQVRATGGTHPA
ncbi:Sprouty-related, EVH1 domain-containing protein 1 [Araneus ventricosus]|uniref:Sprouty-related, EVH1 domain-containing protein 1 n=1 Tax=Araneus ventricosus TaxID=182803 RepID=A0A4Y2KXR5_ARAVE|nr:Sprouty-related, EVH1 domain-containing protein 1 [Araneus ventricosus]